jgi:hypothetical protein
VVSARTVKHLVKNWRKTQGSTEKRIPKTVTSLRPSIFEKKTKKKRLLLDFPAPRIEF